jgi:hypothetical protein
MEQLSSLLRLGHPDWPVMAIFHHLGIFAAITVETFQRE